MKIEKSRKKIIEILLVVEQKYKYRIEEELK